MQEREQSVLLRLHPAIEGCCSRLCFSEQLSWHSAVSNVSAHRLLRVGNEKCPCSKLRRLSDEVCSVAFVCLQMLNSSSSSSSNAAAMQEHLATWQQVTC